MSDQTSILKHLLLRNFIIFRNELFYTFTYVLNQIFKQKKVSTIKHFKDIIN